MKKPLPVAEENGGVKMITLAKAMKLLVPGEDVFIREDGKVVPVKVLGIYADSLRVEGGVSSI